VIDHGHEIQETTMAELLAQNRHFIVLTTDQDDQAMAVVTAAGYHVAPTTPLKVQLRSNEDVSQVLAALTAAGITVADVRHEADDLEQAVLQLIAQ